MQSNAIYIIAGVDDYGRPWSVYEAYQIIIQHQVEALIELGAQESLKVNFSIFFRAVK